jgi:hypothetical protein
MPPVNWTSLAIRLSIGAAIGLALCLFFVLGVDEPHPAWPQFWMIRPLIILPLAGATGGAINYFLIQITHQGGWKKTVALIFSALIFLIGLWMGTVLGLVGTMWN